EWIRTIERIFEYADIPPRDQVKCATHLLRESARHWWDAKRRVMDVSGLGWEDFKQMFFEKYFPPTYRNQMRIQFLEIRQGENSVDEYIAHFDNLSRFAQHIVSTTTLLNEHFLRGLRPSLYGMVRMAVMQIDVPFTIIATKAQEAEEVERHIQRNNNLQESGNQPQLQINPGRRSMGVNRPNFKKLGTGSPSNSPKGKKHSYRGCSSFSGGQGRPHTQSSSHSESDGVTCYECGRRGHFVNHCYTNLDRERHVPGRVYNMTEIEAAEDPNVVTGEVSIFDQPVRSLFDTGASHSFISMTLVTRLGLPMEPLDGVFCIAMPSGETMYSKCTVSSCPVKINEKCYPVD